MRLLPIAAGTFAVAALTFAGATWYTGERMESYFQETLPELSPAGARIEVQEYQRGFFNSSAHTVWHVNDGENVQQYRFAHDVQHIPFPNGRLATVRSHLEPTEWLRTIFPAALKEALPLLMHSTVEWNGDHSHALSAEALRGQMDDMEIGWGGFSGVFDITNDNRRLTGELFAPLLLLRDSGGASMSMEQLTTELEFERSENGLWTGPLSMHIDRLHSREPGDALRVADLMEVNDLTLRTESSIDRDDLLSLSASITAAQARIDPHTMQNFELSLSLGRLDANSIASLLQHSAELTAAGVPPDEKEQAMLAALEAELPQLLSRAPAFDLERLAGTVPEGEFSMHAWLRHNGDDSDDLEQLIKALSLKIGVDVPRPFMLDLIRHQEQATIDMLAAMYGAEPDSQSYRDLSHNVVYARVSEILEMGLIVEDEERWLSELELEDGQLTLNEAPADELLFMLLGTWLLGAAE